MDHFKKSTTILMAMTLVGYMALEFEQPFLAPGF